MLYLSTHRTMKLYSSEGLIWEGNFVSGLNSKCNWNNTIDSAEYQELAVILLPDTTLLPTYFLLLVQLEGSCSKNIEASS